MAKSKKPRTRLGTAAKAPACKHFWIVRHRKGDYSVMVRPERSLGQGDLAKNFTTKPAATAYLRKRERAQWGCT